MTEKEKYNEILISKFTVYDAILNDIKTDIKNIDKTVNDIKIEIGILKFKSGVWGLIGGALPFIILIGYKLFGVK